MNKFELLCAVVYSIDADWQDTHDEALRQYLSDANPFLFANIGSADPWVFTHFCEVVNEEITIENSYSLAQQYVRSLNNEKIMQAFSSCSEEDWKECISEYLAEEHKGSNWVP